MASIKTAVSIPQPLFTEAEALADRLGVSRSRLYAKALAEYMEHHENERLLEMINAAYVEPLDKREKQLLRHIKRYQATRDEEE